MFIEGFCYFISISCAYIDRKLSDYRKIKPSLLKKFSDWLIVKEISEAVIMLASVYFIKKFPD
jgi:hypothetical protein